MNKRIFGLATMLLALAMLMLLSACGGAPKPPSEKEIANTLPDEVKTLEIETRYLDEFDQVFSDADTETYEMDVESVSIEKRQTNEKSDVAYCVVELKNDYYCTTKYVELHYNYYDEGGWMLDEWSTYAPSECEVLKNPLAIEKLAQAFRYNVVGAVEPAEYLNHGMVQFSFEIENPYANGSYKGTVIVTCQFDGFGWQCKRDATNVDFIWNITGKWKYEKFRDQFYEIPGVTVTEGTTVELTIRSFDQNALSMEGTWDMRSQSGISDSKQRTISLQGDEQIHIKKVEERLVLTDDQTDSTVVFYPDGRTYVYYWWANQIELVRTELQT